MSTIRGLVVAALVAACGGGSSAQPEGGTPSAGGEEVVSRQPSATLQSYVGEGDQVVVRLDMERVRSSSLSEDIGSLVNSYPMWQELLGSSGIDPVRDFDRVLITAPAVIADRSIMLIRHNLTNTRVREAVLSMAVEAGQRPEWETQNGFSVVRWPAETEIPRYVVITGEHELVVTTEEDLPRVLVVANDHAARRTADEAMEPALALEAGTIATVVASEIGGTRFEYPPDSFQLTIREVAGEERRIELVAHGTYADETSATSARAYFNQQRDFYAGHMLARAVGLDRPLREAQIGGVGNMVDLSASFTEEEIERVLGLFALAGMSGG
jgi:hypothetical protein